jgi:Cft2 family RNA processing exonuclease
MARARKPTRTPYPVLAAKAVAALEEAGGGLVSAKTLLDGGALGKPRSVSGAVGNTNKSLHKLWAEGRLVAFADPAGTLLREEEHVAPGSKAVEHPQVFATPGTPAPPGFAPVTYAAFHSPADVDVAQAVEVETERAAELSSEARALFKAMLEWRPAGPAPAWLPEEILRLWVTWPSVVGELQSLLTIVEGAHRQQLVATGLPRRGDVSPDGPAARGLVRLCRTNAAWWADITEYVLDAYLDSAMIPHAEELPRLRDDPAGALDEFPPDGVLLVAMRLGLDEDVLGALALEVRDRVEEQEAQVGRVAAAFEDFAGRIDAAEQREREATKRAKDAERKLAAAETRVEALRTQRRQERREQDRDDAARMSELEDQLARAEARIAELAESEGAAARASELEEQLGALEREHSELLARASLAEESEARVLQLEREVQDTLRQVGELNVELERTRSVSLPAVQTPAAVARALAPVVGAAAAAAGERLAAGAAAGGDAELLAFAARYVEFAGAVPAADEPRPDEPAEHEAPADEPAAPTPTRRRPHERGWLVRALGGADEIGGSAFVAVAPSGQAVLLDCGQRVRGVYGAVGAPTFHYGIPATDEAREGIAAIVLSHAHVDHVGSLPVLHRNQCARQGADIPIYASEPTAELARVMLLDSARVQNAAARDAARLGETDLAVGLADRPAYDVGDVNRVAERIEALEPFRVVEIPGTALRLELLPVAHVLGSCAVRLVDGETDGSLLYTGDLGPFAEPQLTLPDFGLGELSGADLVLLESTYGARPPAALRVPASRRAVRGRRAAEIARLLDAAGAAVERGGFALIPTFSLGRMQELVRTLGAERGSRLPASGPIYVAGLGERVTEAYTRHGFRGDEGVRWARPGEFPATVSLNASLERTGTVDQVVRELLDEHEPGYLLTSPAALAGGWSLAFAKAMVEDERHAVILTGYLPQGERRTRALSSLERGDRFEGLPIRCLWTKAGLSAHATSDDLREVGRHLAAQRPGVTIGLVHGERPAQQELAADLAGLEGVAEARGLVNGQTYGVPSRRAAA